MSNHLFSLKGDIMSEEQTLNEVYADTLKNGKFDRKAKESFTGVIRALCITRL